ncbi:CobW family GTP-binding protein [Reinekea blandensis]|uniref:Putative GTPase n=1 Tax=Reinekea blandensis MED297 TaxID=314283 RepID=A4BAY7_9GAMM|nr:GTP-binding protein [Reinekea blandensis]EAR10600.1 putative GTPase [Reinekea sp. MED297] [Reinekea blandensis MED297]
MATSSASLTSVPTNIITGFLGVGKTSAILNLLKHKPAHERWAILVNEFGEIGVDGALIDSQPTNAQGVFIREVPGGCMCCAAGVPMQVALNELLKQARPDRLLIEPTGLGHPKEVLSVLTGEHYRSVLSLQKTVTLVDARKLTDERYTRHETFNQQIAIADLVVGNKTDLYAPEEFTRLVEYVADQARPGTEVRFVEQGRIDVDLLLGESDSADVTASTHHHHHPSDQPLAAEKRFPASGVIKAANEGEGYVSLGWRITPEKLFDYERVQGFIAQADVERLKAVFITERGIFSVNKSEDNVQQMALDEYSESRIEVIALQVDPTLETELLACLR